MSDKYWYEEGMCKALGYKGQYPVIYRSEAGTLYKRVCMGCTAISDGRCRISDQCQVILNAPEQMEYNWQLRDKKIG